MENSSSEWLTLLLYFSHSGGHYLVHWPRPVRATARAQSDSMTCGRELTIH